MDVQKFLEKNSLDVFPSGFGGCRNSNYNFDCCEYNVTIFDNSDETESIVTFEDSVVKIHHASFAETKSPILVQFLNMNILNDEQWELRMFLSKLEQKKEKIFSNFAKESLIDSLFCATKAKDGIESDPYCSVWIKCGAYYIADAISALNHQQPSPTHMLDFFRKFEKNRINEKFAIVNDIIGVERATPSLLERMCKSTMGFSDMIEDNGHSQLIDKKFQFLVKESLLSDCYFYLGYINRNNFIKIKNTLHRNQDYVHVLNVAFDLDKDLTKIENQANQIKKTANELLENIAK